MSDAPEPQQLSEVLLDVYRAARELPAEQFQEAVIHRLRPIFRFDSSMWGTGTRDDGNVEVRSMHLDRQPAEMLLNFLGVAHEDTVTEKCVANPGRVLNFHAPTLFGGRRDKAGILDHALRFGSANGMVTVHAHAGMPLLSWISLYRENADAQFSERERILFESIFPHVVEALTMNRLLHLDAIYSGRAGRRAPVAIIDRKGAIYHSDGGFQATLRNEWPHWSGATLPQPLLDLIRGSAHVQYRGRSLRVASQRVGDLFFVRARKLGPVDHLTARERQVAEGYTRGMSHKEIAAALGLAPATVRNYLQSIYTKLGVSDKASLAVLLTTNEAA